jgi:D-beta-D-heptose 7-phosphate kinase / D-beta-D-heptose 1-phosphate adenosyltransferase
MSRHLLVIGDTLLDRDVLGTSRRNCPDAPAPVVDVESVEDRAGGAGLAAALAADPNWSVTLVTRLGPDEAGVRAVQWLQDRGIRVRTLPGPSATAGKTRVVVEGRVMLRLDDRAHLLGSTGATSSTALLASGSELDHLLGTCDAVLVSDYGGGVTGDPGVRSALSRHLVRRPVVWDPHPRGSVPLPGACVVTPNRSEAEQFSGRHGHSLASVARDLRVRWDVGAVSVTDGSRGVSTSVRGHGSLHTAAPAVAGRFDPCGAGDRFAGRLARGLGEGLDLSSALRAAADDASRWLSRDSDTWVRLHRDEGQPSLLAAMDRLERVRAHGGCVVATGGCFDVLHAGHLALLEAAADMGDALVVLLNSDASVWRRKGGDRPVNSVADRARLLRALRMVDAVVVFEEDDPRRALAALRPDVWVKGGDYRPDDLVEAELVERLGGRVEIVPFAAGFSTSSLLERVAQGSGPTDRP